ncbi:MAG: universal stress protein [Dehalococcoidales bacterium]|nr:universal stress protein [Dehalococcoidales bacterium]
MYNKVLVPLDGFEIAECILDHVRTIVTGCQVSEVVLLGVIEAHGKGLPSTTWGGIISDEQEAALATESMAEIKNYLTQVADKLKAEGVFVQPVVLQGNVAEKILDYAIENQVDLIMMSTHGRSGLSRWALGSVADRVVRHSPVPVLIVSPKGSRINS